MICTLLMVGMAGCVSKSEITSVTNSPTGADIAGKTTSPSQPYLTFKDMAGQEIILPKKPERIVILAAETLDLFYQLGGKAVGRASATGTPISNVEQEAQEVGQVDNISLEKIVSLKPDLVIGQYYFNASLKDTFSSSNIPFALMKITSYNESDFLFYRSKCRRISAIRNKGRV
jgi:iron complex transport system substrate-binding protein